MTTDTLNKIKEDLLRQQAQLSEELSSIGQEADTHRAPQMPDARFASWA